MARQLTLKTLMVCCSVLLLHGCGGDGGGDGVDSNAKGDVGQAGSMARFSIVGDYLYAIDRTDLQIFEISSPDNPVPFANIYIGWNIETIFSYQDALFIGAQNGVFIYDNTDPANPIYSSEFFHAAACDPVVVSGEYAYVTQSSGNRCRRGNNVLDVLNVADIYAPYLENSFAMQNPKGLGVDNNRLFVCDGIAGLKVYDLEMPQYPAFMRSEDALDCYDVIANNGFLVVSDNSGILQYQYNYVDADLTLQSEILIDE